MKKKARQPAAKRGRKPSSKVAPKAGAPAGAHHALDAAFEFIHKVGGVLRSEELISKLKSLKVKLSAVADRSFENYEEPLRNGRLCFLVTQSGRPITVYAST